MQSIIQALEDGQLSKTVELIKSVRELKSATLELPSGSEDHATAIAKAKRLWNAAVTSSVNISHLEKPKAALLAACRELSFLILQKYVFRPWDDKTLIQIFETSTRVARCFSMLDDWVQARAYLSKASDFKAELDDQVAIMAPVLEDQLYSTFCVYFVEKIKMELKMDESELRLEHLTEDALRSIKISYLPHFISDVVHSLKAVKHKSLLHVLEILAVNIRPIESFPAHISDDLIYMMIDQCLEQGQKPKLEQAAALFDNISLANGIFFKSKLKFNLAIGAPDKEIEELVLQSANAGVSLLGVSQLLRDVKGAEGAKLLESTIDQLEISHFSDASKSELVELKVSGLVVKGKDPSGYLGQHLQMLNQDSRNRLQALLVEQAEMLRAKNNLKGAINLLRSSLALISKDSELDKVNEPILRRHLISCMLQLGQFDEAEEMIIGLPFDLNGLTFRLILAISMNNIADACQILERVKSHQQVDVNALLSIGDEALKQGQYEILLKILLAAVERFDKEPVSSSLKLEILRSGANIVSQVLPASCIAEKSELMIRFMTQGLSLMIADDEVEHADVFFKATWNAGVEAGKEGLFAESANLFHLAYRMLSTGQWSPSPELSQAKISCICACLSSACHSKDNCLDNRERMLREGIDLMEDIEISSTYLPEQRSKRLKCAAKQFEGGMTFDLISTTRTLDQLAFQVAALDKKYKEAEKALESLRSSATMQSLEELISWSLERREVLSPQLMLRLLELLAEKVIQGEGRGEIDLVKFSFIYRGMAIFALGLESGSTSAGGTAYEYFKQALAIVKMYGDAYPREEVCWLAVSSYNQALRISAMSPESAQIWCELSLALLHHTGRYREAYEASIRAGYSKILQRVSI